MKIIFILFLFLYSFSFCVLGQSDSVKKTFQAIHLEVLGIGGYGSINYERAVFNVSKKMITLKAGLSAYQLKDFRNKFNPDLQFPLTINGNYGDKHKIEVGLGQVISTMVEVNQTDYLPSRMLYFHSVFLVGYRYQKYSRGLIIRINYTPLIEYNQYFKHWAGMSFGYSF